mgnify:CR=1 FL=1
MRMFTIGFLFIMTNCNYDKRGKAIVSPFFIEIDVVNLPYCQLLVLISFLSTRHLHHHH